jgi:hypothetical protein
MAEGFGEGNVYSEQVQMIHDEYHRRKLLRTSVVYDIT